MKKHAKKVSISIEEKVWSDYIKTLEERTGIKRGKGHIGPTIEKLLTEYIKSEEKS